MELILLNQHKVNEFLETQHGQGLTYQFLDFSLQNYGMFLFLDQLPINHFLQSEFPDPYDNSWEEQLLMIYSGFQHSQHMVLNHRVFIWKDFEMWHARSFLQAHWGEEVAIYSLLFTPKLVCLVWQAWQHT